LEGENLGEGDVIMSKNQEIADIFGEIANILEFKGENLFRINAYRKASGTLEELHEDLVKLSNDKNLEEIPGIGKNMAEKIEEYLVTGKIKKYEELISEIPVELLGLLNVPNLGAKTLSLAYSKLGVKNLNDLQKVIQDGSLAELFSMGEKKVENIKKGIELFKQRSTRIPLGIAIPIVEEIIGFLKKDTVKISPAGSLRRRKVTVGDIDILSTGKDAGKIMESFTGLPIVKEVLAKGDTKSSVIIKQHQLQVDLRVVPEECYGAALQYFTGSKEHNIKLRTLASEKKGLKINEYGVFKGGKKIAGITEEEIYKTLGIPWIPPELREDRGEIESALDGKLPVLVERKDIKGDLHIHSKYSDGIDEIRDIAFAAKKRGYIYVGISDHSISLKCAGGLDLNALKRKNDEIDRLNEEIKGIKILKGAEVDILGDGRLDYPDKILEELDFAIAAIHQGFKKNVTDRMKKTMENPFIDIIAHPTGRLLTGREGYEVNIDEVIEYAGEKNTALEINACYDRLDLDDIHVMKAKKMGVKLIIGTDAHKLRMLKYMDLGIGIARRGWLEKQDVLNGYDWEEVPLKRYIAK